MDMRWLNKFLGMMLLVLCPACSSIDESERFVYVKPAAVRRAVLIEEFTGQRCVNCPTAALEIEKLQQQYGESNVIAVAIHSGPLAIFPANGVEGLRTSQGDEYYDYFGVEMEPSAVINRRGAVVRHDAWGASVYDKLQEEAPVHLSLSCQLQDGTKAQTMVEALVTEDIKGQLQLWLTEDSITAPQMMPDGTVNGQYVHRQVLRSAVNGSWGSDIDWRAGDTLRQTFSFAIDGKWNARRMYVVAFIYTADGVQQVCREKIEMKKRR